MCLEVLEHRLKIELTVREKEREKKKMYTRYEKEEENFCPSFVECTIDNKRRITHCE